MAITERTRPYETLIRHNQDGSIGAHHQTIYELLKGGEIISSTINSPEQLSVADGENGLLLSAVLGAATAAAIKQVEGITTQLQSALADNSELETRLAAAATEIESLKATLSQNEA